MAKNEKNDEQTSSKQMATMDAMAMTCTSNVKTTTTKTIVNYTIAHRKNRNLQDTRWQRQNMQHRMSGFRMIFSLSTLWLLLLMLPLLTIQAIKAEQPDQSHNTAPTAAAAVANTVYSQPFATGDNADDDDSFRPIIPKNINPEMYSRNIFTETGQYRVFQPVESDLRATAAMAQKVPINRRTEVVEGGTASSFARNSIKTGATSTPMSMLSTTTATSTSKLVMAEAKLDEKITKTREQAEEEEEGKVENHEEEEEESAEDDDDDEEEEESATEIPAGRENIDFDLNEIPQGSHESSSMTASNNNDSLSTDLKGLEDLLVEYVQNFFITGQYEPLPGLLLELQKNRSESEINPHKRSVRQASSVSDGHVSINLPRAFQTGRLLFFAGLKKIMWPIYMGLQILKSVLFAMFLPTIIGSFGKLIGKGITSGSVPLFIRPMDAPQELDFKDNTFNFEDDNKFIANDDGGKDASYAYNQPEASQTQNQYAYNAAAGINHQALSRYGMNEQQKMQDSYLSALQSISSASFKNSNSISGSSSAGLGGGGGGGGNSISMTSPVRNKPAAPANMNTFTTFQRVPASSLLLSNYDPFYSPLLSRLDSVFAQLKLNSENEICREKLICLMYANPAKYAPYSNLVSAQLSRELNELRKPTSDNADILRFFKYMRAAKDGQDGIECEKAFDGCKEFKDFENPAMVSTYNDINKLVQARKMT